MMKCNQQRLSGYKLILLGFVFSICFSELGFAQQFSSTKLNDGVMRYTRATTATQKHGFWQQLEKLFDVVIGADSNLPFGRTRRWGGG